MKPNLAFQKAMQTAVGSNPALAQQLSDLEANAPGTLGRMGFGALGDAIKSIPESEQSQFKRQNRGEIMAGNKTALDLQTGQTGFDLGRLNETIDFLKDPSNKAVTADMILTKLTGQTSDQRTITGAAAKAAPAKSAADIAQAGADTSEAGLRTSKAGVARQAFDEAMKNLPNLKNTDFLRVARDFISGKTDGATISSLFNTPGAQEALSKAISSVEEERQIALREQLASLHGNKDQKDQLLTREAFARYQATKGAGTLSAWKTILNDPSQVEAIKAKAPDQLTQEDKDILHASDAQDQLQSAVQTGQVKALNTTINSAMGALNGAVKSGAGQAALNSYMNGLNAALAQKGLETGKTIIARYGKVPDVGEAKQGLFDFNGKALYFVDAKGNRVDDSEALDEPQPDKNRADAMRAAMTLQGMNPDQKSAELKKMKASRPDIYGLVIGIMK
jgi:hypothetical protein